MRRRRRVLAPGGSWVIHGSRLIPPSAERVRPLTVQRDALVSTLYPCGDYWPICQLSNWIPPHRAVRGQRTHCVLRAPAQCARGTAAASVRVHRPTLERGLSAGAWRAVEDRAADAQRRRQSRHAGGAVGGLDECTAAGAHVHGAGGIRGGLALRCRRYAGPGG